MVDTVSNSSITADENAAGEKADVETTPILNPTSGLLELTIIKAELTGEKIPEFTQSFASIKYGNQFQRTHNAAQKDQHRPIWNTTIKIPITNDEADEFIEIFMFTEEINAKYERHSEAKVPLKQLCVLDKKGGGWITLQNNCGKVLLSSKYRRIELTPQTRNDILNEGEGHGFDDMTMHDENRRRLDSVDYKMADFNLEANIDSDGQ